MSSPASVIRVKKWYWFCLAAWVVGFVVICLFHVYAPGSVRTHRYKHTFNDEELYMMSLWGFTGEASLATGPTIDPSDGMVYAAVSGQSSNTKPKMHDGHIMKSSGVSNKLKNKVETRTNTKEIHRQRAKNIRDVCAKQRHEQPSNQSTPSKLTANHHISNLTLNRMYVSDSHRFMFCYIPDNGLNNMQRLKMLLNNSQLLMGTDDFSSKDGLKILRNYSPEERQNRLKSYKKMLFVREPLTRMIAIWLNKRRSLNSKQNTVDKNHRNATVEGIRADEDVTWFSHLTNQHGESNFDGGWMQISDLCSPCDIAYDFIGKLETVNDDINYISKSLNLTNQSSPFPAANSIDNRLANKTLNEVREYFKDVSKREKQTIWDMYKLDYQLFGYQKPDIFN